MDSNEDKSEMSKSKRTFVLGVVDTSGMKSAAASRKRRWDQPPEESEEVDGAAPMKVTVTECAVPAKPEESIEDELQDVFYDTSETLVEESPAEDIETPNEPTAAPTSGTTPMETVVEVGTSVSDEPENVSRSIAKSGLKLASEKGEEETKVTSEASPVTSKGVVGEVNVPSETVSLASEKVVVELPTETALNEEKRTAVKVTSSKLPSKNETKTVAPVIISDSLKAIQFCYDEDDSNSSEGSDSVGLGAAVPPVAETATGSDGGSVVQSSLLGSVKVSTDPSLDTNDPEEEVPTSTRIGAAADLEDEVLIEPIVEGVPQEDVIVQQSLAHAKVITKDRSRSPTPVLADEPDEDTAQQATELVDTTVILGGVQVFDIDTMEGVAEVEEDTTVSVCVSESAVVTGEHLIHNALQDNLDMYEATQPADECIIESELVAEAAELEEGIPEAAVIEDDVSNVLFLDSNIQQNAEESRSPEASKTEAADKGLEQVGESFSCNSSLMNYLNAPSELSANSRNVVKPLSENAHTEQHQTNLTSMDNSQNCCVSFDDMSNLDKTSSKSPELELRYTDSEESSDVKHSNPEVTMHFASVRTQDSVPTPDSTQEGTEELKDESAVAADDLTTANPDLEDKPLRYEEQTQSQSTMEMLDSLVRRSSEDDPSRLSRGGGLLSEDSLINEINQLPDQDSNVEIQESSKCAKKEQEKVDDKSGAQVVAVKPPEIPQSGNAVVETEVPEPVSAITNPPQTVSAPSQEMEKSETPASVEEELSQGTEEESKNVTVSSANILEVIFGSEQKSSSYPAVNSLEGDAGVKENKVQEDASSMAGTLQASSASEKPVSDSKLQLKNEDFEMGSAEIVAVDPTKSLSGEDSDEDEVTPSKPEASLGVVKSTHLVQEPKAVDVKQVEGDDNRIQFKEGRENVQSHVESEGVTVEDVLITEEPQVVVPERGSVESKPPKAADNSGELEMDVDDSSANNDDDPESSDSEKPVLRPMAMVSKILTPLVKKASRAASESKHAEASSRSVKEPVPVLIIKKQSLPSKKLGETVETLLTCSPKSTESVSSSSPSRKPPNESLHVDTIQEVAAEIASPKHSPITLRIYKDNLTVKTDLDSPKRNKSPLSSDFKSELSPRAGFSDVSPQNKQLEFTLKIAKDANTNQPKATMSPKHVASPTSVWKSEVHVDAAEKPPRTVAMEKQPRSASVALTDKPSHPAPPASTGKQSRASAVCAADKQSSPVSATEVEKQPNTTVVATEEEHPVPAEAAAEMPSLSSLSAGSKQEESMVKPTPTRGRGRGRGGTPRRTPGGRGRRGGAVRLLGRIEQPFVTPDEDASEVKVEVEGSSYPPAPPTLGLQMTDAFKRMMSQEKASLPQPEVLRPAPKTPIVAEVTPVAKKRGRPRKSVQQVLPVPEEIETIKVEPMDHATTADASGGETGDDTPSGRPKRTCRGRTKPIVVRKKRGGSAGPVVPRGASTPLPVDPADMKEEGAPSVATLLPTEVTGAPDTLAAGTAPTSSPDKATHTPAATPARGRGNFKRPTPDRNTLSEKELAELQKIEARKEKLRLDRIAKYEAKKAKKLAKKLKDEERRKRQAQEKAEKAAAAAPQVFEEETRMSAPDSSSRGHTPAPNRIIMAGDTMGDESQNSTTTPGDSNRGNKKGRMEISIGDLDCLVKEVRVDDLAEYQWQGSELYMIQEQVSLYLGVKSFKRKYPGLKRRTVEAEERTFLEDSGLVPKSMCDLGITAVSSSEILDIMFQDFPDKYEEFRKHVRDKQAREASYKQKAAIGLQKKDGTKVEPREQALEAVASWNANLNRERKEERKCALDLQTFTVHYPKVHREQMAKPTPKVGLYPVAVIPGQFCDFYKKYTPNELMYFPINTVVYGPLKPNERQKDGSDDGSASETSSSSSSSSSSGESSSESDSEGEDPPKCVMCNGTRKKNRESLPEVLLNCVQCKTSYHPSCKEFTPEMTPHLVKYEWQCTACKQCTKCRDPNLKDRIMCCQLCDRGYHLSCIGLKKMPEGRWHCSVCAYCSSCDSRNPGGSDWQHEFKKGEKGTKVYQRTLCTPCFKLWRKGKYCQLCSKCHSMKPEEDPNLIQCNSCDRWLHKECYGTKYGIQNKLLSTSSIQCDICVERIQNSSFSGLNRSLIKV